MRDPDTGAFISDAEVAETTYTMAESGTGAITARLARPQRKPILHLPTHWPWEPAWITLWHNTIGRRSSA